MLPEWDALDVASLELVRQRALDLQHQFREKHLKDFRLGYQQRRIDCAMNPVHQALEEHERDKIQQQINTVSRGRFDGRKVRQDRALYTKSALE